jgi:hypothetical protein
VIDSFAEGDLVEPLQESLVETSEDTAELRSAGLDFGIAGPYDKLFPVEHLDKDRRLILHL